MSKGLFGIFFSGNSQLPTPEEHTINKQPYQPPTSTNSRQPTTNNFRMATPRSIITATLCDSRSCHQTGGGEHVLSDIEDLLSLLPPPAAVGAAAEGGGRRGQRKGGRRQRQRKQPQHRVTLTTCFGLCNHSPNIQLKSAGVVGHPSLQGRRGKLVNDGGFRMRVQEEEEPGDVGNDGTSEDNNIVVKVTDTAMVSNLTISKVARAIGLKRPLAVRALECKSQGDKFLQKGRFDNALECYSEGRALSMQQQVCEDVDVDVDVDGGDEESDDDDLQRHLQSSSNKLLSKIILSCAITRVKWSSELMSSGKDSDEATEMLHMAAGDVFRVLLKSYRSHQDGIHNDTTTDRYSDETNGVVAKVVHCSAGLLTQISISNASTCSDEDYQIPSLFGDLALLVQFCTLLADAWRGLIARSDEHKDVHAISVTNDDDDAFLEGALIAYKCALAIAAMSKARILRGKERRRIEKAISALES